MLIPSRSGFMSHATIIPALKDGEHLTKEEFLRRCEAFPRYKHAELLEGIVHLNAAAINARNHGLPHTLIAGWLWTYKFATPGVTVLLPSTMDLGDEDLPEPDAMLLIDHPTLGSTHESEDGWLVGPAELVVEIAASTRVKDLGLKKRLYEKAGVKEYIVWSTTEQTFDWFVLQNKTYTSLAADPEDGLFKSQVYPGLWLDCAALFKHNESLLIERLQTGIKTPEHASFVRKLKR
ncbi:Uma2 family endonuclease [Lacunimicrobium album]